MAAASQRSLPASSTPALSTLDSSRDGDGGDELITSPQHEKHGLGSFLPFFGQAPPQRPAPRGPILPNALAPAYAPVVESNGSEPSLHPAMW